jgi:DNA primase
MRHEDATRIRDALRDPYAVCDALGLISEGRGRTWFADNARSLRVLCPWHDERTGSCSVSVGEDGTIRAHCFGCKAGGDVLSLVAAVHRLDPRRDFVRVLDIAATLAGIAAPVSRASLPRWETTRPVRRAAPEPTVDVVDDTIDRVTHVFRESAPVSRSPVAMGYLRARKLDGDARACSWFALPRETRALDMLRHQLVEHIGQDAWMRSGMAWPSGVFDPRWAGRLVVPWEAPNGAVEYLVGRVLDAPGPRYLGLKDRSPRWPFGSGNLIELSGPDTSVVIVEGAIDAVSCDLLCARRGLDCIALAIPGVDAWRDAWADLARARNAIVGLDADKAGALHATRIKESLALVALSVTVREPANGKDWNELLCTEAA